MVLVQLSIQKSGIGSPNYDICQLAGEKQEAQKANIADQVLVNGCEEQGYWRYLVAFLNTTYCGLHASNNEVDRVPYLTEFASTTLRSQEDELCFDRKTPAWCSGREP